MTAYDEMSRVTDGRNILIPISVATFCDLLDGILLPTERPQVLAAAIAWVKQNPGGITTEARTRVESPAPETQPISGELWAIIRKQHPAAAEVLCQHAATEVIVKVGTSKTLLTFPQLTRPHCFDELGWSMFTWQPSNPTAVALVIAGTPANGFSAARGLRDVVD